MVRLDHREKGGYERLQLPLRFEDGSRSFGTTYHANEANPNYLGEASVEKIALQIVESAGPSGSNIDYILNLESCLKDRNETDPHVTQIANRVRRLR